MYSIFSKEIKAFFNSLVGYIIVIVFLLGVGLLMWVFQPTVFDNQVADMSNLFTMSPFMFLFFIPAITMRMLAEEKKTGTLEILLTKPISEWDIILGKFWASFALIIIALLPTLVFYVSIYLLGNPIGNIDTSAVLGSYFGLVLLGASFTAIGLFSSSITDNQIIAFIISLFISFIFFLGFDFIADIFKGNDYGFYIKQIGFSYHYEALSRGVIDLRNVAYLGGWTAIMLGATTIMISKRKW